MLCPTLLAIKEHRPKLQCGISICLSEWLTLKSSANTKFWKEAEKHMHQRWDIKYDIAAMEDGWHFPKNRTDSLCDPVAPWAFIPEK